MSQLVSYLLYGWITLSQLIYVGKLFVWFLVLLSVIPPLETTRFSNSDEISDSADLTHNIIKEKILKNIHYSLPRFES